MLKLASVHLPAIIVAFTFCYGCGRDKRTEAWVSPQYQAPPYPVINYCQVGNKIVRVMESPSGLRLHIKNTDGVVFCRAIDVDKAIKKYPDVQFWLTGGETNPIAAHLRTEYVARSVSEMTSLSPHRGPHCPPGKLKVLGSVWCRDWVVTALLDGRARVYCVEQCGHLIASGLPVDILTNKFPEMTAIPSYMMDTALFQQTKEER